ncbi:hypothetical protein Patl1_19898 [Pistacia atlantica]|uniref:Uncharacterized protein n=1 Tax=Pistacia atlantica TaxID=434234 RepID=A0ACC1BJB7_9ROSI|nr:hypothetical protein Patl1_19898 [Pistacia atlantica]
MITKQNSSCYNWFKSRRRGITTCTLQLESSPVSQSTSNDHNLLCLSLAEQLIKRGLISSAQQVIRRIIANSASVSDAISVVDFAKFHGMDLDMGSYRAIIKKLVQSGQWQLALSLYCENIVAAGIDPDSDVLNSVVICYCEIGELEDAMKHFNRIFLMDSVPVKPACNAILRELYAQERFLEAFDYFVRIHDAGVNMSFSSYNILIDGLCYKGYLNEAMKSFEMMRKISGLTPSLHLYKSLFYGFCKRGWVVEAESLFEEMESQGFFVDKMMYTSLMNAYSKDKKMKMAMRVYLRMLKTGCEPDSYSCNTLIHGFVTMGLFDKGWVVFNQMIEWGLQPNMVTYHIIISNYCRDRNVDCALTLLNNMLSNSIAPSVHCYTDLIASLYKENRLVEIDELYKNMLENGVVPDDVLSFILMKKCPKGQELQLALMVLLAIAKNGCGIDPLALSTSSTLNATGDLIKAIELLLGEIVKSNPNLANVAFGVYVSALSKRGESEYAFLCMDKLVSLGCRPLLITYNSLIKCLCQEGLFEEANSLIELMQDSGTAPDTSTYLIMVSEYCKRGDIASAYGVLHQMDMRGLKPGVSIYDRIIGCLFREKRILEAEVMFKRMLEAGVDPDEVVYVTMINGYSKNGKPIEACQLFEKMIGNSIQPSSYSYTALISGLVKKGMMDKGCMYLDRMLGDGFVPNAVLYTSLINHFLRIGEFEFAFKLVDLMDRNQIEGDLITYIALVSGVCRHMTGRKRLFIVDRGSENAKEMLYELLHQRTLPLRKNNLKVCVNSPEGMKSFALKLVKKVKEIQFMPNLYLYNGIISGFCGAGRIQDAHDHLEMMQREGVCPNQVTYTILIDGHIRAGEIDCAIGFFNKMNADGCAPDRITYNTLLKGLCQAGRLPDAFCLSIPAFKMFGEMIAHGYVPRPYSYNWEASLQINEEAFGGNISQAKRTPLFMSIVYILLAGCHSLVTTANEEVISLGNWWVLCTPFCSLTKDFHGLQLPIIR